MSFKNWARDVKCLLSRFRKRKLTKAVDGEAKEEASRLADVAATIFIQPAENTPTSVEAPVSAPTTMDMSQAVAASNTDGMPVVNMVAKKVDTPPVMVTPTRECLICTEKYEGDEVLKVQFPFDCGRCGKNAYCAACISKWFLDACRNESRMPPKCCYAIPITTVSDLLNPGQVSRQYSYVWAVPTIAARSNCSTRSTRSG